MPTSAPEPKGLAALEAFQRYADGVNTDRYCVTCIRMELDGEKKGIYSRQARRHHARFYVGGNCQPSPGNAPAPATRENINYIPLPENKHHIFVDDMSAESLIWLRTVIGLRSYWKLSGKLPMSADDSQTGEPH